MHNGMQLYHHLGLSVYLIMSFNITVEKDLHSTVRKENGGCSEHVFNSYLRRVDIVEIQ